MTQYAAKRLRRTAYHEAGHAVVACLMHVPFHSVTVAPGPVPVDDLRRTTLGQIELNIEWPDWAIPFSPCFDRTRARRFVARDVCMTLAGPLAETLHTRCWQQQPGDEQDDEWAAYEIAEDCRVARSPKATREWVNRLRFSTLEMLRIPYVWAAVDAVAGKLVKRKRLNSAQVHQLVCAALPCESDEPITGPGTRIPELHQCVGGANRNRRERPAERGAERPSKANDGGRRGPVSGPHGKGPAPLGQPGGVPPRAC
jgi:hypothetical protein